MGTKVGLTGSRLFARRGRPGSDFDFFVEDSPQVRAALLAEGFTELPISGKAGPNMRTLFRLGNMGEGHIDVGLVASFDRKNFENRMMTLTPFRIIAAVGPKSVRTFLWKVVQSL